MVQLYLLPWLPLYAIAQQLYDAKVSHFKVHWYDACAMGRCSLLHVFCS